MVQPDRAQLKRLLSERNQYPERANAIDAEIIRRFTRKVTILALDMSGFSKLTAQHGVIHFLAMVHQMEQGARPAVTGNGGTVIKQEADNLFAIFEQPAQAVEAALDIHRTFDAMNSVLPDHRDIYVSVGIGYGDALVIDEEDMFGHEMNLACKLGEDIAKRSEILLTAAAHATLPENRYVFDPDKVVIGGGEVPIYRYRPSASSL